jgi:5-methylcytosine-specific restriction endonuclease McrA
LGWMGVEVKKLPHTPTSRIKNDLRRLWLRSRERAAAIKREGNTCQRCGKKGSVAKGREVTIEVHHIEGIRWDEIVEYIRLRLLIDPSGLEVFCKDCHKDSTFGTKKS